MQYTYLIGWSQQQKFYYGVRYAKNSDPEELWKTYFTSSKHVKMFRQQYGEPDVVEIRRRFTDHDDARQWETRVLTKLGVPYNPRYINQTNNKAIYFERTEEWRRKISGVNHPNYGKPSTFAGKKHKPESNLKNRQSHLGKKTGRTSSDFTPEWKANLSKNHPRISRAQSVSEIERRSVASLTNGFPQNCKGSIWMNDGTKSYRIKKDKMDNYTHLVLGRLKIS